MKKLLSIFGVFLVAGSSAFVPACTTPKITSLKAEELTATQKEIQSIQEKWNEIRMMTNEEAASLEGEWKEAYERFYAKYETDMANMKEIAEKLKSMIEPPRVQKKTKGQRKRDKFAIVQARLAARAAKK